MNVDSVFINGSAHLICQDYAASGIHQPEESRHDNRAYAIISDGCSSSPDTDIGSRLLTKTAEQLIQSASNLSIQTIEAIHHKASHSALRQARALGLGQSSVDATLLSLYASSNIIFAACSGDGVIVFQSNTGLIDAYVISFPRGFPLYPSYIHQPDRLAALSSDQRFKEVSHYKNTGAEGALVLYSVHESTSITEIYQSPTENNRLVAIFTDGILSFSGLVQTQTSKSMISIPIEEVLLDFLSFKTFNGAFLRRRFKRVREQYQRKGWINQDDLGCGIIYLGSPDGVTEEAAATSPHED
ncbi:MAG: hypothetical protein QOH96_1757 [Blastocatellia bacterium]|nr:hypothetical protein [Blastocatellia bacterium]